MKQMDNEDTVTRVITCNMECKVKQYIDTMEVAHRAHCAKVLTWLTLFMQMVHWCMKPEVINYSTTPEVRRTIDTKNQIRDAEDQLNHESTYNKYCNTFRTAT